MEDFRNLRINAERFKHDFHLLAGIGTTADGGVHRPAFCDAHLQARGWFMDRAVRAGLNTQVDGAGNHMAILPTEGESASFLLIGSHLDSVPFGGRYDGALGVAAALEVLETIKESGLSPAMHLAAVDFTDEEGAYVGLMGSRAMAGILPREEFDPPTGDARSFMDALHRVGLSRESVFSASRSRPELAGYFELHIEQGATLHSRGIPIGVVTGIVGIRNFRLKFKGRADHAGTTGIDQRLDPGIGACDFLLSARDLVMERFPDNVFTVGDMVFKPGAFNVIPEFVAVSMEFRADNLQILGDMETAILKQARTSADKYQLDLDIQPMEGTVPVKTHEHMQSVVEAAASVLDLNTIKMPSGAGHDAQAMAAVCPIGMIFVPSSDGRSHSAKEYTSWEDCVNGANVLLQSIVSLLIS